MEAKANKSDLVSTAVGKGASLVGVADVGNYYVGTNTEATLREIAKRLRRVNQNIRIQMQPGEEYTIIKNAHIDDGDVAYYHRNGLLSVFCQYAGWYTDRLYFFGIGPYPAEAHISLIKEHLYSAVPTHMPVTLLGAEAQYPGLMITNNSGLTIDVAISINHMFHLFSNI